MGKYNLLQSHLWSELQNYSLKPKTFFFVILFFSLLQTAKTITTRKLSQPDDLWITQLLAAQ